MPPESPDARDRVWRFLRSVERLRLGPLTLREEGGYRAGRLTFLTRFLPSAAYLDENAHCFIGEDLVADPLASDDDEFFERRVVPFREALTMALDDRITESVSKLAILAAALRLRVRP